MKKVYPSAGHVKPHPRSNALLLAVLLLASLGSSMAAEPVEEKRHWYQSFEKSVVSVGWAYEAGDLRGPCAEFGWRGRSDEASGLVTIGISRVSNGPLVSTSVYGRLLPILVATERAGVGPLLSAGAEIRDQGQRRDQGGYLGAGVGFLVWTDVHWQFVVGFQHLIGLSSDSRNRFDISVGYALK